MQLVWNTHYKQLKGMNKSGRNEEKYVKEATYTRVKLVSSFALRSVCQCCTSCQNLIQWWLLERHHRQEKSTAVMILQRMKKDNNEDVTIVRKKAKVNNDVPPQGSNMQQQQQQRRSTSKIMKKELTKQHQDHQQKFDDIKCLALLTSTTLLATST